MARLCLDVINEQLEGSESLEVNVEINEEWIQGHIEPALRYGCTHLLDHALAVLVDDSQEWDTFVEHFFPIYRERFVPWIQCSAILHAQNFPHKLELMAGKVENFTSDA